jgi:hypothetical protein
VIPVGSDEDFSVSQAAPSLVFVVTVRDNAPLLADCLRSVAEQDYGNVRCLVIDDGSGDGTAAIARHWASTCPERFSAVVQPTRRGKMANLVDALETVGDHEVVVELDGDDRLLAPDAASDLARLHGRADLVWTQHRVARGDWPTWVHWRSTPVPPGFGTHHGGARLPWSRAWYPGHLRSFKAWAFRRIDPADLMVGGRYVRAAADAAYFTPLVEMTPPELRYFYDRELCLYNITAANDHFADDGVAEEETQQFVAAEIFRRRPYAVRPAPLWVGVLGLGNEAAVRASIARQLDSDPGSRFMLAAVGQPVASWHPRVQVLHWANPRRSEPGVRCEQESLGSALRWVTELACAASGAAPGPAREHVLPLVRLV